MHVPMQVDYGVRALVDLAANGGDRSIRAADIARRQGIPELYLAQVLHSLQKRGVTKSQRGPQGGHSLAMDPADITMGTVMRHLGGSQTLVGCLDDSGSCDQSPACGQRSVWREVEQAIQTVLDATSIADLAERTSPKLAQPEAARST
jgi:Rrf2 family iron-sulfur cluster assembly transcriptional regulator